MTMQMPSRLPVARLEDKVAFLRAPQTHPAAERVEVQETHMSWVFLAAAEVYKLKKPVRYPFLDFSTLAARKASCNAEVSLNARLAPGVYLGVVALTREHDGRLALDGTGEIVDWLVHMRRLPADKMLDRLIIDQRLDARQLARFATRLADFYAGLPPAQTDTDAYIGALSYEHRQNMAVLRLPQFEFDGDELGKVDAAIETFLVHRRDLLQARVNAGRVIEGHGDLRPEHVCLTEPPVAIDCLEFNRALRIVDWADEIAFLGLECARLGAPWVGAALRAPIVARLHDTVAPALTEFYTALRASLRARLSAAHLLEPAPRDGVRWLPRARSYLHQARAACAELNASE